MTVIRLESPLGKIIGRVFFGFVPLAILFSLVVRIFLTALFAPPSCTFFSSGANIKEVREERHII